jgi:hypothetical protein
MELYREIGRIVCQRPEKGAAVAVAEHLTRCYLDAAGFSPRNLRRMRDFYRMYGNCPKLMEQAMNVGWTQNVVIMEAELTPEERSWYLNAAAQFGWSKAELQRQIEAAAHLELPLDETNSICYTESKEKEMENSGNEDTFSVLRQHMSISNSWVRYESSGEVGWTGKPILNRVCSYQHRGNCQSGRSPGPLQTGRVWDRLYWQDCPPDPELRCDSLEQIDQSMIFLPFVPCGLTFPYKKRKIQAEGEMIHGRPHRHHPIQAAAPIRQLHVCSGHAPAGDLPAVFRGTAGCVHRPIGVHRHGAGHL